jgi:1-acyl-sn-glycerol-3-phosphate acyltransferase
VTAIQLGLPIVPVVCCGTREVMPKGGYLAIVPGDIDVYIEPPISTQGLTLDDLDGLRTRTRDVILSRLDTVARTPA